jgi:hypothetical protein
MDAQQIIEQLADRLGRRVELVAPSPTGSATAAVEVPDPSRGIVPVDLGEHAPYLRLDVDGREPLTAHEYDLVSGAIDLLRLTPTVRSTAWTGTREAVLLRVLTSAEHERTDALHRARMQRWIDPRGILTVHALLFDGRLNDLERFVFGRSLASSARSHGMFAGVRDGVGFLLTGEGRDPEDVRAWIVREATERRVGLIAVGSANVDRRTDDVLAAAEEARIAADIRASLGSTETTGRSEDLGAWRLLHAVSGSGRLVASASPAADELWNASDPVQRETIEAYLDAGCRVATACQRLHIHRTTLYYRLENMPPSVRDALDDGLKRSTLHLALKLLRLREGPVVERPRENAPGGGARRPPTPIGSAPRPIAPTVRQRAASRSA